MDIFVERRPDEASPGAIATPPPRARSPTMTRSMAVRPFAPNVRVQRRRAIRHDDRARGPNWWPAIPPLDKLAGLSPARV